MLNFVDVGRGTPIVLVHGFSDQSMSWFLADKDLFAGYRVVSVDLPGHGRSEPWEKEVLNIHDMADEVNKVVRTLGMGKFALAGHSMGGMVAQQYCVDYPQELSCLFLCCTTTKGSLLSKTAFNLDRMRSDIQKVGIAKALSDDPYSAFAPGYDSPLVGQYLEMELSTDGPTAVKCLDAMRTWELVKKQAIEYRGTAVIICGESDRITPASFALELAEAFPGSTVEIIRGAGHMVFLERPREFQSLIRKHSG
jgi:pimeloyl-ACP methyl ester carboxylesterase